MRKLRLVILLSVFFGLAIAAQADSIPTFNISKGTALVMNPNDLSTIGTIGFDFNGPNAFLGGSGTVTGDCGFCVNSAPPGFSGLSGSNSITGIFVTGGVTFGGVSYNNVLFHGIVVISSSTSFSLPNSNQDSFTITVPVTFSGQLTACPAVIDSEGNLVCGSPDVAAFKFQNLKGKVKIDFLNTGNNSYSYVQGLYTITQVPEPATLALVGAGSSILLLWRRKGFRASGARVG